MIIDSQFKPAWWLTNPHAQTVFPAMKRSLTVPVDAIEKLELPDGDFLELLWSNAHLANDSPLIIILHGLTGGVNSGYVGRFMKSFNTQGWRSVLIHFRCAGKELNRLPRAYHSGDTADLNFVVNLLAQREPETKKAVVGVSLGGNVLLKWLGEQGPQSKITTAVAISVPFVLNKVADKMNLGLARFYQRSILKQLKLVFSRKLIYLKNPPDAVRKAAECHCFWTFDHHVTAPLNGFSSAHSYYRESSSRQYLQAIATKTLIIHSKDDPFMTLDVLPTEAELSESVTLELSKKGGHVGFIAGNIPGVPVFWLNQRVVDYIAEQWD